MNRLFITLALLCLMNHDTSYAQIFNSMMHIDDNCICMANISQEQVDAVNKVNNFPLVKDWPIYRNTGLPNYTFPKKFIELLKNEKYITSKLDFLDYRVFQKAYFHNNVIRNEQVMFYNADKKILVILYIANASD